MSDRDSIGLTWADLEAAWRREPAALKRVYVACSPALHRFFMASLGDPKKAKDLTTAAFVRAIGALPGFHGPIDEFHSWLLSIARPVLFDFRRTQSLNGAEPLIEDRGKAARGTAIDDREELAINRLEGSRVLAGLRRLSPDQREVLLLRMAGGLTAPEVAEILGKTTGTVKTLQHRGLMNLARVLGLRTPATHPVSQSIASGAEDAGVVVPVADTNDESVHHRQDETETSSRNPEGKPAIKEDAGDLVEDIGRHKKSFSWGPAVTLSGLSLVLVALSGWSLAAAEWLVSYAAPRVLPKELRNRYSEEWLTELAALDEGRRAKFAMALSIFVYALSTRRALRRSPAEHFGGEVTVATHGRWRWLEPLLVGVLAGAATFAAIACSLYLPSGPPPSRFQLGLALLAALLSGGLAAWQVRPRREKQ